MAKRESLLRALTRPFSVLLFWQSLGWIAFGFLEPSLVRQMGGSPDAGLVLIVSVVMATSTAMLGVVALFFWRSTVQKDFRPRMSTHHKCLSCGYPIETGMATCPHCGAKTLF